MTQPILLTDAQQQQVQSRLRELLSDKYGIINQSDGLLTYAAAYIMGFDNHHQRQAVLRDANAPELNTAQWPTRHLTAHGEFLPPTQIALISSGWTHNVGDHDGSYWETRLAYQAEETAHPHRELVLRMVPVHANKTLNFVIGDDDGTQTVEYLTWCMQAPTQKLPLSHFKAALDALRVKPNAPNTFLHAIAHSHAATFLWQRFGNALALLYKAPASV